jgi:hypothetical protein
MTPSKANYRTCKRLQTRDELQAFLHSLTGHQRRAIQTYMHRPGQMDFRIQEALDECRGAKQQPAQKQKPKGSPPHQKAVSCRPGSIGWCCVLVTHADWLSAAATNKTRSKCNAYAPLQQQGRKTTTHVAKAAPVAQHMPAKKAAPDESPTSAHFAPPKHRYSRSPGAYGDACCGYLQICGSRDNLVFG